MPADFRLRLPGIDALSVCTLEARGLAQFIQRLNRTGMHLAISPIEDGPDTLAQVKAILQAVGLQTLSAAVQTSGHKDWISLESMSGP